MGTALTLEQVSTRTGVPVEQLRKQQLAVKALRRDQPVSVNPPQQHSQASPRCKFSPQSGPLRLQKQMCDAGLD